jgi:hypothetical protein
MGREEGALFGPARRSRKKEWEEELDVVVSLVWRYGRRLRWRVLVLEGEYRRGVGEGHMALYSRSELSSRGVVDISMSMSDRVRER